MNSDVAPISDAEFLAQFESRTLDPVYFDHVGHMRLVWLYLGAYDLEVALAKVSEGIQAYAMGLGAATKYHVTVTDALVRIMAKRINAMQEKNWRRFLQENSDLVKDAMSVLCHYYTKDRLLSEQARVTLISPDLHNI